MVTDIRDPEWWEGYREIGKDGVLDWDENATKAFFPRGFVEVVWCEALFTEAGGLGINFGAAPNTRGRLCFTIHQFDPGACAVHAPKLREGMGLDTVNGKPALGMTKGELLKAIAVRPLLLSFVSSADELYDTSAEFSAKVLYDYDGLENHGDGYLTIKRGQLVNVTSTEDDWWEGYCTLNPFAKGVFPASFVELLSQESTASVLTQNAQREVRV